MGNLPKAWYESKLVWLGVLQTVLSVLLLLQGEAWLAELSPQLVAWIGTAIGILTVFLRFVTGRPIAIVKRK